MAAGLLIIFLWALFEEIVKATGVRLATGDIQHSVPGLVFRSRSRLKDVLVDRDLGIFSRSGLAGVCGSGVPVVIHLYTCIFYGAASSVAYALGVCTLLHTAFNVYAAHGIKSVLLDPTYNQVLASSWIMSSIFGIALLLAFKLERRILKA